jgi:hypothetical protein
MWPEYIVATDIAELYTGIQSANLTKHEVEVCSTRNNDIWSADHKTGHTLEVCIILVQVSITMCLMHEGISSASNITYDQ